MDQNKTSSNSHWNTAAKDGLILSLVTIVCMTLGLFNGNGFLGMVIWVAKLVGSILLLKFFMKRFSESEGPGSNFGYGVKVCLCSSLVCAAYSFLMYGWLFPEKVTEIFDSLLETMSSMGNMPDESRDIILTVEDNYPQLSCLITFFWCSFLGIILSAILRDRGSDSIFTEEEMRQNQE